MKQGKVHSEGTEKITEAPNTHLRARLLYGLLGGPGSSLCQQEEAQCFQTDSAAEREKVVTAGLPGSVAS